MAPTAPVEMVRVRKMSARQEQVLELQVVAYKTIHKSQQLTAEVAAAMVPPTAPRLREYVRAETKGPKMADLAPYRLKPAPIVRDFVSSAGGWTMSGGSARFEPALVVGMRDQLVGERIAARMVELTEVVNRRMGDRRTSVAMHNGVLVRLTEAMRIQAQIELTALRHLQFQKELRVGGRFRSRNCPPPRFQLPALPTMFACSTPLALR
jgi:hypothetical protein